MFKTDQVLQSLQGLLSGTFYIEPLLLHSRGIPVICIAVLFVLFLCCLFLLALVLVAVAVVVVVVAAVAATVAAAAAVWYPIHGTLIPGVRIGPLPRFFIAARWSLGEIPLPAEPRLSLGKGSGFRV